MKNITFIVTSLYLLLVIGCTNQKSIPSKINNSIKKLYDGFANNDSSMISSVLSDNYKSIGVWNKEDKRNKDEEINFAKTIHSWHTNIDVQDRKYDIYKKTSGYKAYVTGVEKYKHNETGNSIDLRFSDVLFINENGIIEKRERYLDRLDYMEDIDFGLSKKIEVTFLVDMSNTEVEIGSGEEPSVYIVSGANTGPSGVKMTKGENDIWSGKVMMPPGEQVFKFRNGYHKDWDTIGWEDGEKLKKEKCGFNQWGDREVVVNVAGNQVVGPYCFSSCKECS